MVSFDKYEDMMKKKMTIREVYEILGDRASWELNHMRKALNISPLLLTEEDIVRKKAVNVAIRNKKEYQKMRRR